VRHTDERGALGARARGGRGGAREVAPRGVQRRRPGARLGARDAWEPPGRRRGREERRGRGDEVGLGRLGPGVEKGEERIAAGGGGGGEGERGKGGGDLGGRGA
jgi:hypothetical protein